MWEVVTTPPKFIQFHHPARVNMRGGATMTRTDLLGSIKEMGPTIEDKLAYHNILQGLHVTQRLSNHPR